MFYSVDGQKTDFFLSSTHQPPEAIEGRAIMVPRKSGRVQKNVETTPIHLQCILRHIPSQYVYYPQRNVEEKGHR
jgi:hypothetical protein